MLFLTLCLFLTQFSYSALTDYPNCYGGVNQDYEQFEGNYYKYLFVNATGVEDMRCSSPRRGCHTLKTAVERVIGPRTTGVGSAGDPAGIQFTAGLFDCENATVSITKDLYITGTARGLGIVENDYDAVVMNVTGFEGATTLFAIGDFEHMVTVSVAEMTFMLYSTEEAPMNVSTFVIYDDSALALENVHFNVSSESTAPMYRSLISANKGKLTISETDFNTITMEDKPLISFSPNPDLSAFQSQYSFPTFTNIVRNNGNGSVLELSFEKTEEQPTFSFGYWKFVDCKALNGYGGAVYVSIMSVYRHQSIDYQHLEFEGTGSATSGKFMYVMTNNTEIANPKYWEGIRSYCPESPVYMNRNTNIEEKEYVIEEITKPSVVDLYNESEIVFITPGAESNITTCGSKDQPCRNLSHIDGAQASKKIHYVTSGPIEALNKSNTPVSANLLLGASAGTIINVMPFESGDDKYLLEFSSTTIRNINFAIVEGTSKDLDQPLLSLSNAYFCDGSITKADSVTIKKCLITSSGSTELKSITIDSLKLEAIFLKCTGSTTRLIDCTFSNIETTAVFLLADSGSFSLTNTKFSTITIKPPSDSDPSLLKGSLNSFSFSGSCTFSTIVKEQGDGAVFNGEIYDGASMWSATFEDCQVKDGKGGAIALKLPTPPLSGTLNFAGKYSSCSAKKDKGTELTGCGGAVFIDLKSKDWSIECDDILDSHFSSDNSADVNGTSLFVLTENSDKTYETYTRFPWYYRETYDTSIVVNTDDKTSVTLYPQSLVVDPRLLKDKTKIGICEELTSGDIHGNCSSLRAAITYRERTPYPLTDPYFKYFSNITIHAETTEAFPLNETNTQADDNTPDLTKRYVTCSISSSVWINGTGSTNLVVDGFTTLKTDNNGQNSPSFVISSSNSPYVTFTDLSFSINTTKGYNWKARTLFDVDDDAHLILNNVNIAPLSASSSQSSFVNMRSNEETEDVEYTIQAPALQKELITVSGYIDMTSVTIQDFVMSNIPLMTLPSMGYGSFWTENRVDRVKSSGTKFVNIVRNEGNGAVLEHYIEPDSVFQLNNFEFENCKAANGNGGAVAFIIDWGGSLVIGSEVEGVDVKFSKCSAEVSESAPETADAVAGCGGAMYLVLLGEPIEKGLIINKPTVSDCKATNYGTEIFAISADPFVTNHTYYWTNLTNGLEKGANDNKFIIGETNRVGDMTATSKMEETKGMLKKPQRWYQRWWIWLIIGLAILVVIVVVVVIVVCCCCCKK